MKYILKKDSGSASLPAIFTISAISLGVLAFSSASIVPEDIDTSRSGVCVKAYNNENQDISAVKCTYLDSLPGGSSTIKEPEEDGGTIITNPEEGVIPHLDNPPTFYYVSGKLWSTWDIVSSDGATEEKNAFDTFDTSSIEDFSGNLSEIFYDPNNRQIVVSTQETGSNSTLIKVWRENGANYEFLGSMDYQNYYFGGGFKTSPNGNLYFDGSTEDGSLELFKVSGGNFNKIKEINYDYTKEFIRDFAIDNDDSVLYLESNGKMTISKPNGENIIKSDMASSRAMSISGNQFIINTDSGFNIVNSNGDLVKSVDVGHDAYNFTLSGDTITYFIRPSKSITEAVEARTYNITKDEHKLWAYFTEIL